LETLSRLYGANSRKVRPKHARERQRRRQSMHPLGSIPKRAPSWFNHPRLTNQRYFPRFKTTAWPTSIAGCKYQIANCQTERTYFETRHLLPHRRHACVPPFLRPLFRPRGGRLFGGSSKCIVSYDARVATKWRHWLDRKAWTQNAKTVRCKCKENDYEHCGTFHVSGFYRLNRSMTRKF
jgi:hypothetical protein